MTSTNVGTVRRPDVTVSASRGDACDVSKLNISESVTSNHIDIFKVSDHSKVSSLFGSQKTNL